MYAVVSSGGKQYRVEPGTTLTMERVGGQAGDAFTFDRVLLIGDGDEVTVGTPVVSGATVSATLLGEELGPKLVIFKFKQKVKYRRRTGHRQHLVRVRIDAINADGSRKAKATKAEPRSEAGAEPAPEAPAKTGEAEAKPARKPRATRASGSRSAASASKEKQEKAADEKPAAKPRTTRRAAKPKAETEE